MTTRELDALIAEKVMGIPDEARRWSCPGFSTDPAASKKLRDKMLESGWSWQINSEGGKYMCCFWKDENGDDLCLHEDSTEELAVALAALRSISVSAAEKADHDN